MRALLLSLLALSMAAAPLRASTAAYPERPIRLIVPFPPGGGTDLVSRTIQPELQARLGTQIVVDNRGGAQGLVGSAIGAQAAPDGYTLVIAEIGAIAVAPAISSRIQFDPVRDFAPITKLIEQPYIMSVHPSVPAKTLGDFIRLAQSRQGTLNYGSGNTTAHVAQEVFYQTAKIKLQHIPYRGSGPSVAALVGGEVQVLFSGPGAAIPQIKAGRIRGLAVTTIKRSRELPDLPTLDESGFRGFEISGWYGLAAPARTPPAVIARLNGELRTILSTGEAARILGRRGYDPAPTTPEAFGAYLKAEVARWSKAVRQFGIKSLD